jgi:hypothetical protein
MVFHRLITRRDALLFMIGALSMQILTLLIGPSAFPDNRFINIPNPVPAAVSKFKFPETVPKPPSPRSQSESQPTDLSSSSNLPETSIISHAPGWTIFSGIYMAEGTLFIVSSYPKSYFPPIRMMTSTGLEAANTPENIRLREPSADNMDFISPEEAKRRWGGDPLLGERNRVWTVNGNTVRNSNSPHFIRVDTL